MVPKHRIITKCLGGMDKWQKYVNTTILNLGFKFNIMGFFYRFYMVHKTSLNDLLTDKMILLRFQSVSHPNQSYCFYTWTSLKEHFMILFLFLFSLLYMSLLCSTEGSKTYRFGTM